MSRFETQEPWLIVKIEHPEKKDRTTISLPTSAQSGKRVFKRATIVHTFDERLYPKNSSHIMGEEEPLKIDYFGEELLMTKSTNLYGRDNTVNNEINLY